MWRRWRTMKMTISKDHDGEYFDVKQLKCPLIMINVFNVFICGAVTPFVAVSLYLRKRICKRWQENKEKIQLLLVLLICWHSYVSKQTARSEATFQDEHFHQRSSFYWLLLSTDRFSLWCFLVDNGFCVLVGGQGALLVVPVSVSLSYCLLNFTTYLFNWITCSC